MTVGITFILPLVLLYHNDREKLHELVKRQISITHRSDDMFVVRVPVKHLFSSVLCRHPNIRSEWGEGTRNRKVALRTLSSK